MTWPPRRAKVFRDGLWKVQFISDDDFVVLTMEYPSWGAGLSAALRWVNP